MKDELMEAVSSAIGVLSILPNTPGDIETVTRAWYMVAKDDHLTATDVQRATRALIRSKFFPTPGEFAEAAKPPVVLHFHTAPALPEGEQPTVSEELRAEVKERFRKLGAKFDMPTHGESDELRRQKIREQIDAMRRES